MKCKICDKKIDFCYGQKNDRLKAEQLCFTCYFWQEYANEANDPSHIRVDGHHYVIGREGGLMRGFGGREFVIRLHNGVEITTHNLWHQGKIPEHFRHLLPNNATFVNQY